jgi:hypothetical protein
MSEKLYNLEFSGQIIPGWDLDEVKDNLAKLLKANEEKIMNSPCSKLQGIRSASLCFADEKEIV